MKEYRYINIKEGNEYHALVDSSQNIYNQQNFFYPVYAKSVKLVKEICKNSSKESGICQNDEIEHKDYSNNIIMYCAERGGGKSTAMLSFANALKNFNGEQNNSFPGFTEMWGKNFTGSLSFLVLSAIDPTEISESDLFLRIVFSKMFTKLKNKWNKEDSRIFSDTAMNEDTNYKKNIRNRITKKFTECYRYLDVIYQKKGQFEYDDDLDDLTDLGDSGNLRGKFWDLVKAYLEEMTGSSKNFLVIQIDDADLNSSVTYKMIEDIRKYCIIPNVIILMSVNIVQMHYVLEQNFVTDFKPLLDVSKVGDGDGDARSIHLRDCQKMAMRYIDKVMPAAHQIHLPKTEDYINNIWDLKINYDFVDEENDSETVQLLEFKDKSGDVITNYQEIFIHLIYKKTGIVIVKPTGYIHNILPKTMRGLSHFLAYMRQLPDLDENLGIAEINELINVSNIEDRVLAKDPALAENSTLKINEKDINDAEAELRKRIDNLEALRLYFLKNWCTVRLTKRYQEAIEDIDRTVVELKVKAASSWIDRLFKNKEEFKFEYKSELLPGSYAYLREKLQQLTLQAHRMERASVIYHFVYALRFYFLLEFNRTFLSCVKNGKNSDGNNSEFENAYGVDFGEIFKLTTCDIWFPSIGKLGDNNLTHFKINPEILKLYRNPQTEARIETLLKRNCIIRSSSKNDRFLNQAAHLESLLSLSEDEEIVFDFGASLLCSLINVRCHDEKIQTYNYNLKYKNCLIALLSSWELQRYIEKKSVFEKYDLGIANQKFNQQAFDCLNNIKYLPINSNRDISNELWISDNSELIFSSKDLVPYAVKMLFVSLKNKFGKLDPENINPKQITDTMTSLLNNKISIDPEQKILKMISPISPKAGNVYNAGKKIQAANSSKTLTAFEKNLKGWLDLINNDQTIELIIKQVINKFNVAEQPKDTKKASKTAAKTNTDSKINSAAAKRQAAGNTATGTAKKSDTTNPKTDKPPKTPKK